MIYTITDPSLWLCEPNFNQPTLYGLWSSENQLKAVGRTWRPLALRWVNYKSEAKRGDAAAVFRFIAGEFASNRPIEIRPLWGFPSEEEAIDRLGRLHPLLNDPAKGGTGRFPGHHWTETQTGLLVRGEHGLLLKEGLTRAQIHEQSRRLRDFRAYATEAPTLALATREAVRHARHRFATGGSAAGMLAEGR